MYSFLAGQLTCYRRSLDLLRSEGPNALPIGMYPCFHFEKIAFSTRSHILREIIDFVLIVVPPLLLPYQTGDFTRLHIHKLTTHTHSSTIRGTILPNISHFYSRQGPTNESPHSLYLSHIGTSPGYTHKQTTYTHPSTTMGTILPNIGHFYRQWTRK